MSEKEAEFIYNYDEGYGLRLGQVWPAGKSISAATAAGRRRRRPRGYGYGYALLRSHGRSNQGLAL